MLDFEGIGQAHAYGRSIREHRLAIWSWMGRVDELEVELAETRAWHAAHDAGRLAQLRALRVAMERLAPLDPIMCQTGRHYDNGDAERAWEAEYADAYDDIARKHDIPLLQRPMTPAESAVDAERQVLAEPISIRRCLWWRRFHFRGVEHRSEAGARRAREQAAREARTALSKAA